MLYKNDFIRTNKVKAKLACRTIHDKCLFFTIHFHWAIKRVLKLNVETLNLK